MELNEIKKKKGKKLFLAIINAPYHGYIILPLDNYNGETCLYCFNESNKQLDPHGHVELLSLGKYISNDSSLFLSLTKILNYRGARVIRFKIRAKRGRFSSGTTTIDGEPRFTCCVYLSLNDKIRCIHFKTSA